MTTFLLTAVAGFIATGVMSGVLFLIQWRGLANADMINAVGSLITRDEKNALAPGLLIHFASGILFAFIYVGAWSMWGFDSLKIYTLFGFLTGAAHGLVVSFILVALVAEHHPIEKFQSAGLGVAAAHWVGHVVYGLVVGGIAGMYALRYDFVPVLAQIPQ